jgi:hypothetical protein
MDAAARATKQNLLAFFTFLARSPATDFAQEEGLTRWRTPVPHPWFNGIRLPRPPQPGDDLRLDRLAAPFDGATFTVWIDADVPRTLWHPLLAARGYQYERGAPGMVYPLAGLPPRPDLPPGFVCRPVRDAATLRLWCDTFMVGYELPPAWAGGFLALLAGLGLEHPVAHYLGLLDGTPVATSSLFYAAGVAGVQFVSTIPPARRRGLGGLMTLLPLYDARTQGCQTAILQSSDQGYPVYRRLGFTHVYDVDNYYLGEQGAGNGDERP